MSITERPPDGPKSPPPASEEKVLVVPRDDLARAGVLLQGFSGKGWELFLEVVARRGVFYPRGEAEEDPNLKQVIPYGIVTREDRVFLFQRSSLGGEARLHHKLSVGVGGHINPEGVPPADLVEAGLLRELQEELIFDTPFHYRPAGLINDDQTAVGRVHMGIVYLVEVERESVRVRETEILEGGFVPVRRLPDLVSGMETWSQLVVSGLFGI